MHGRALTWQGVSYTSFEKASALTASDGDQHIAADHPAVATSALAAKPSLPTLGTEGDDFILGTGGDDILRGGGGNDVFVGGTGNDTIDGGGVNHVELPGKPSDCSAHKKPDGSYQVSSASEGRDVLHHVDAIHFQGSAEWLPIDPLPT
ncbi:hypothetical protein [Methylobacterium sp. ID0610]|uniref:hypothetical protein n=1 Tax=Methylobacterium carpenticola TaxID=3344827 RepID=UPI0036B1E18E